MPSPVLDNADPVLLDVIRKAGFTLNGQSLVGGEGLTLTDAKAACYANREDLQDAFDITDDLTIRSDREGWAADTEFRFSDEGTVLTLNTSASQPLYGYWVLDSSYQDVRRAVLVTGFCYDLHSAAASLLDMLAAKLKLGFTFSDGSGTYARREKYDMVRDMAKNLRAQGRVRIIDLTRGDTSDFGTDGEGAFFIRDTGTWP